MWKKITLIMLTLLSLASCQSAPDFDQPPEIRYGEDSCDRCLMIINEARYAAAYITVDGETRRFDDIGGMLVYTSEQPEDVAVFWVHDYETEEWLKAETAVYVMDNELITPMGFGIIAFATHERAETFRQEHGGMIVDFEKLLTLAPTGELSSKHSQGGMGHEMEQNIE